MTSPAPSATTVAPSIRPVACSLRAHEKRQLAEKMWAGSKWNETSLVFAKRSGGPTQARHGIEQLHGALKDAGIRRVRSHDRRHARATLLLVQGVSPREVREVQEHAYIARATTAYGQARPEPHRE